MIGWGSGEWDGDQWKGRVVKLDIEVEGEEREMSKKRGNKLPKDLWTIMRRYHQKVGLLKKNS